MRIAIVNDLVLAREALKRVVQSHEGWCVAWVAQDGTSAVTQAERDPPEVILMDLIMPGMDGVEATRQIMARRPCPILVVTSTVAGNYQLVLQAMSHGAIDAVQTPELGLDGKLRGGQELIERLGRLERARKLPPARTAGRSLPSGENRQGYPPTGPPLVALGASTGGPEAVAQILEKLPTNLAAPVVVIQHISAEFGGDLVTWLRSRSALPVETAQEGARPKPGVVAVAVTNDHLILSTEQRFHYTPDPIEDPYRPSVNSFFESLANCWPAKGVAVLLTGMGQDGARGLAELKQRGWCTIAQDQSTSVVYGMPRAAVELQATCEVLPIGQIAGAIRRQLGA